MKTRMMLAALLAACAAAGAAVAETLVVNDQVQVRESQLDRPKATPRPLGQHLVHGRLRSPRR